MPTSTPNWIKKESERAEEQEKQGTTANDAAPKMRRSKRKPAPARKQKGLYVQEQYATAFDRLAFDEKLKKGKSAPELAEEAIELLLNKYKVNYLQN